MRIDIIGHPSGDWEALYIDGHLADEGHSITVDDFINAVNKDYYLPEGSNESFELHNRDLGNEEGFDEDYEFPTKYEDITI